MKIFISHSKEDLPFVQPIVELFESMGITPLNMFCSSMANYDIPLGGNIFNYLRNQFQNYDLRVIYVLSQNYYKSAFSLNEMGAAWVLGSKYNCILLPHFSIKDVRGVVDQMNIYIELGANNNEVKYRIDELKNIIVDEFGLTTYQAVWERYRDSFLEKIKSTYLYWEQVQNITKMNGPHTELIIPLKKLIEINPINYDAMYILGTIYADIGDKNNAIINLQTVANNCSDDEMKYKAKIILKDMGYII